MMGKENFSLPSIRLNLIVHTVIIIQSTSAIGEAMRSLGTRGGSSLTNLVVSDNRNPNTDGSKSIDGISTQSFCAGGERKDSKLLSGEHRVKKMVLCGYDATSRPVQNDSTTTRVNVALSLFHILDTDEKHQTFTILVSVRLKWYDEFLRWEPTEFSNTTEIHIKYSLIWTPDIVISNSADDSLRVRPETYTIVQNTGSVLWMYPAVVKVTCTLQVKHFPFDHQSCDLKFISWTYNGHQVDVYHDESLDQNKIYYKQENQEWSVGNITTNRTEKIYACCKEPYPDLTITIHLDRHSLFYIFNLIFPCFLIYLTSFLAFFLPVESGEKVNLELTILLALIVFLLVIGETLPPTPDSIPLLGILFAITMIMVMVALVMGVIVTNIHFRKYSDRCLPRILQLYIENFHCKYHRTKRSQSPAFNPLHPMSDQSTYSPVNRCFNARFIQGVLSHESQQSKRHPTVTGRKSPDPECNELLQRGNGFVKNGSGAQNVGVPSAPVSQEAKHLAVDDASPVHVVHGESHLSLFDDCELSSGAMAVNFSMSEFSDDNPSGKHSTSRDRLRLRHTKLGSQSARPNICSSSAKDNKSDKADTTSVSKPAVNADDKSTQCICKEAESWVIIARITDRIFFWLFTICSVFILVLVVSSIPTKEPKSDN